MSSFEDLEGEDLFLSFGVDQGIIDWATTFDEFFDSTVAHEAQGTEGFQGAIQDTTQLSTHGANLDAGADAGADAGVDASVDASVDAVDVSMFDGPHAVDDVFGPQIVTSNGTISAESGTQESLTPSDGVGYGLDPNGSDETLNGPALGYGGSMTGPQVTVPVRTFDIGMLLDPVRYGMDMATWFSSLEEAKQSIMPRQAVNLDDPTIPRALEQKKAIVRAICTAITNVQNSEDSESVIRPFVEGKYSSERIEIAAWTVLDACIAHHETGRLTAPYGTRVKSTARLENFAERMSKVLHCVETRKTVCKHLLDPPYVFNLVDDPIDFEKRIISNKNLNIRKGRAIKVGSNALKEEEEQRKKEKQERERREEEERVKREGMQGNSNGAQSDGPYTTPEKQTLPLNPVLSPASAARRGISAVALGNSPQLSPGSNSEDPFLSLNIIGESAFTAIPNLRDAPAGHVIHNASTFSLREAGTTYPPQQNGFGFGANGHGPLTPFASRLGPMAPPPRLRAESVRAPGSQRLPMATPMKNLPSSTPVSRKRGSSEIDFAATGSPEKRKQR